MFFFSCLVEEHQSGPASNIIDHKALVVSVCDCIPDTRFFDKGSLLLDLSTKS